MTDAFQLLQFSVCNVLDYALYHTPMGMGQHELIALVLLYLGISWYSKVTPPSAAALQANAMAVHNHMEYLRSLRCSCHLHDTYARQR